jgi:hypothetical protein
MRRPVVALAGVSLACGGLGGPPPPPVPWPPPPPPEAALVGELARVPAPSLVALAAAGDRWVAASPDGRVWRLDPSPAPILDQPAAIEALATDGAAVWVATAAGLLEVPLAGGAATTVAAGPVTTVVATERGPCWAADAALRCREGGAVREVVPDAYAMFPGELSAVPGALVWVDHGAGVVWALDRATGARRALADQRGPHDLAAAGDAVVWSESEADLLPGWPATVTRAVRGADGAWTVGALPHEPWGDALVAVDGILYGAARCAPLGGGPWTRFDTGEGTAPLAVGADRWAWVASDGSGARVLAAPRSACRP